MAKSKGSFGRFIVFATIAGAVAAGISYFTKYRSFHKELEEDFHDFEDDDNDSPVDSTMSRNYVPINADKTPETPASTPITNIEMESVIDEPADRCESAPQETVTPLPVSENEPSPAADSCELFSAEDSDSSLSGEEDIKKLDPQPAEEINTIVVEEFQ